MCSPFDKTERPGQTVLQLIQIEGVFEKENRKYEQNVNAFSSS